MLLVLTTIVLSPRPFTSRFSSNAINVQSQTIADVEEDIGEIQEDVEEMWKILASCKKTSKKFRKTLRRLSVEEESEEVAEERRKNRTARDVGRNSIKICEITRDVELSSTTTRRIIQSRCS